jgi:hypothetical protein
MSKFQIKDNIDALIYRTYNLISEIIFFFNFFAKKTLQKNKRYHNKHEGRRCFILGTGPSLKQIKPQELDALKNEVIFGVNSLYKSEISLSIKPDYYVLMDNLYWSQWSYTYGAIVEKYREKPPVFITDIRAKNFIDALKIDKDTVFLYAKKYPTDKVSELIDRNIYAVMNVISCSILTAIYLGFKEIYLLGCDYNAFCAAGKGHCYDDKTEISQTNYNLAFYLKFYWITTEFHYLIAKLARQKDVKIVNLTPNSLLDAYPESTLGGVLH